MDELPSRIRLIVCAVAERHEIQPRDLVGPNRRRKIAHVRFEAMAIVRRMQWGGRNPSLPQIGRWFGGRDHTTVLHAIRRYEEMAAQS